MITQMGLLHRYARAGVLAVLLICVLALAGWTLGIPVLASIVPGWPRMARIVLCCFVLLAAGVLELTLPPRHRFLFLARIIGAGVVLAINATVLIEFAAALSTATPAFRDPFGPLLGRPSPASAFNF